ncbi:MAG: diguanylate cyclase, partial [Candidatus Limnocylindria bacterium]
MPTELIALIVTTLIAVLFVVGLIVGLPRGAGEEVPSGSALRAQPGDAMDKYGIAERTDPSGPMAEERHAAGYDRALRVVWWLSIAAVLVGVGVSDAFIGNQPLIYALGGLAVVAVVVMHELLPVRWRAGNRFWVEALVALALLTGLVALTGVLRSPFLVGYPLVAVAVALARGLRPAALVATVVSLVFAAMLILDPVGEGFGGEELLAVGANLTAVWLLSVLAGVYAAQERRVRTRFLQLSVTDPLTGLFNRSQIFATLDQEIRRTRRSERGFCVLMIDLDGLKAVNDSLGHHRGDDVLRNLGAVIRRSIRTVDTAYRYGGDEFVVLLPETDFVGAFVVAEKIRAGTEEIGLALAINGGAEPSVSIGLVSHPEDGFNVEELMIAADRAMYQAKSLGKNQISGYPRPRRALPALPPPVEAQAPEAPEPMAGPEPPAAAKPAEPGEAAGPSEAAAPSAAVGAA